MSGKRNGLTIFLSMILALLSAMGGCFFLFAFAFGTDDVLSRRELLMLCAAGVILPAAAFLISGKYSGKTLFLVLFAAMAGASAVHIAYPGVTRLPLQLPAGNRITVTGIEDGASLSLTWAYRFRPQSMEGDIFLTAPEGDISFSQLERSADWEEIDEAGEPILKTTESGSFLGISKRFRTHLAVFCLKAEGGEVQIHIPGQTDAVTITPESTSEQPYRAVLKNGLLPEIAGCIIQIILLGGAFSFLMLCGLFLCGLTQNCSAVFQKVLILLLAFLLPCFVMILLCVILKITPFGEKTFLINDMWSEYADYMAYFRTILSGENDLLYSFSKSLGDDLPSMLAFYVINPLNWIVCLFPPDRLPLAITILVILRYGICGLTSAVYFLRRRKNDYSTLMFSTCYALMAFNIVNAENTNLREGALILPLVIMGLEQLIDGGNLRTYVWSLAAVIFLNYYSGYQIIIFSAIYGLFYTLRNRNVSFGKTIARFIGSTLMAVGISAVLLIPIAVQLQNGPKSFDPSIFKFTLNMPWQGQFGKLLLSAYDVSEISSGFPSLFVSLVCTMLIPLYLMNREISRREKGCTAGLLLVCILILQFNPLNLALHGFSAPLWWPYRYSFIICFFLIIIARDSYEHRNGWTRGGFCLTAVLTAVLVGSLFVSQYSWMDNQSLYLNLVLLVSFGILLCFGIFRKVPYAERILPMLVLLELFLNASHILTINTAYERSNTVTDYKAYYEENQALIDRVKAADDSFYRIEKTYSRTPNDPMLLNYNGITHYSSTLNRHTMDFLSRTGFRRYAPYRVLYWEGSDVAMDSLLGIKYLLSGLKCAKPYKPFFSEGMHGVFRNPYALPVMFTASEEAAGADLSGEKGGFELQNRIFSALTGQKTEIYKTAAVTGPEIIGLAGSTDRGDACYIREGDEEGSLSWNIAAGDDKTLYAFFPAENIHPAELTLNGEAFGPYFDNFSYHILSLGRFAPGKEITLTMTPAEDRVCFSDAQFYYEDLPELERAVTMLSQDKTDLRKITSSHLEGTFTASQDRILFFTIPYDRGWTIKIDGQKVPVLSIFDTFMGVAAPEGEHRVDLRYVPVGLVPGAVISVISVLAALFIGNRQKRRS